MSFSRHEAQLVQPLSPAFLTFQFDSSQRYHPRIGLRENQQLYSGWWFQPTPLKNDGQLVRQGMIFPFPTVSGKSFTSHVPVTTNQL
jgi:hypothetical protein